MWILETSDTSYEIDFHIYDNVGDEEKSGPFSATLTKHRVSNPVSESVLSFKFTMELNGTVINCVDVRDGSIRNCSIDVFGKQIAVI